MSKITVTIDTDLCKVVPVEPTGDMLEAFKTKYKAGDFWKERIVGAISDMLAAVPVELPGVVAHNGEPVAWWIHESDQIFIGGAHDKPFASAWKPLFTHPPAQPDTAFMHIEALQARNVEIEKQLQAALDLAIGDITGVMETTIYRSCDKARIDAEDRGAELAERLEWARQDLIKQADTIDELKAQIAYFESLSAEQNRKIGVEDRRVAGLEQENQTLRNVRGVLWIDKEILEKKVSGLEAQIATLLPPAALEGKEPVALSEALIVVDKIAEGWDGCLYDYLDIGRDIRTSARAILASARSQS